MLSVASKSRPSTVPVAVSRTEAARATLVLPNGGLRRHKAINRRRRRPRPFLSTSTPPTTTKTAASSASSSEAAVATTENSSAFASAASGEWDGMLVTFDAVSSVEGGVVAARELPREFVPEAFREWGVSVRDWQTQCSMRAEGALGSGPSLEYRVRRLLPSVGCEADATAFVDEAVVATSTSVSSSCSSDSSEGKQLLLATLPDGSYALVPPKISSDGETVRVEACLPLEETSPSGSRRRVRLVLFSSSSPSTSTSPPSLKTVEVHSETHDSDYCGGATLSGCGGSVPQFSSKERADASELDSFSWAPLDNGGGGDGGERSRAFVFSRETSSLQPSPNHPPPARKARGGPEGRLLLPLRSWASLRESAAPEGGAVFEAGVLLGGGPPEGRGGDGRRRRKVMTAAYSGRGDLTGVLLATEEEVVGQE